MVNRVIASLIVVISGFVTSFSSDYNKNERRELRVLVVCGHAVSCPRAIRIAKRSLAMATEQTGRKFTIVAAYQEHDDFPYHSFLRVSFWLQRTARAVAEVSADATLVFVEPFSSMQDSIDMSEENILGRASGIGNISSGYALAFVKVVGSDKFASVIALHELGHLLGAYHTTTKDIMNAQVAPEYPFFSEESKRLIHANLARIP